MGLFTKPIKTLDDLFVHTLKDIYYAEQQIVENLQMMADKSSNMKLEMAFRSHLEETRNHVQRLERVFSMRGVEPSTIKCVAINGILGEAKEIISDCDEAHVLDAAMLSAAQAVEHYEITRYGTLIALAEQLGCNDCAAVLRETMEEEKATDKKLTVLADEVINKQAALV
jgi:ferritin-like metal-binding protein YciE